MQSISTLELGTEKINKLLRKYSIPSIIAMTAASLYNITDSIFIGHGVGAMAISGLAISFPLMNLSVAFGSLAGLGGATLLSIRMGQKDYDSAKLILGNILVLTVIIGILFSVITLLFLDPILYFFGASEETIIYARDFMKIILLGNVLTNLYVGFNMTLRSLGNPRMAMISIIGTVLINMALNPLFIFVFKLGIRGSAMATVISQAIMFIWQLRFFCNRKNLIYIEKSIFSLKRRIVTEMLSIGLSPFFINTASCMIVIAINYGLMKYGGNYAVGAYGIVNRMSYLFFMIVFGLNQGMQPIVGYNYGAKQYGRTIETLKKTIFLATLALIFGFIVVELFPRTVASIFTTEETFINDAVVGLRLVFLTFPIIGVQVVITNFFQSIGKSKISIFLSLTRQLIFFLPLLLILPKFYGIYGVWYSFPISDSISLIIASTMLFFQLKKLKNE
ncbi:MAG: MATE family efflux transporter [Bacteroidales bacterium]|jgi:putative MATE family efflux protein|nr:MATE family efflux transporter [Bacteroidales bacterium]